MEDDESKSVVGGELSSVQPQPHLASSQHKAAAAPTSTSEARASCSSCSQGPGCHGASATMGAREPVPSPWRAGHGQHGFRAMLDHPRGPTGCWRCSQVSLGKGQVHTELDVPSAAAEWLCSNSAAKPVQSELGSGFLCPV